MAAYGPMVVSLLLRTTNICGECYRQRTSSPFSTSSVLEHDNSGGADRDKWASGAAEACQALRGSTLQGEAWIEGHTLLFDCVRVWSLLMGAVHVGKLYVLGI